MIVLIADAQRLFSGALALALQRRFDIAALDSRPTSWTEALEAAKVFRPDVVLADYWMGGMEASEGVSAIVADAPESKVIVLSGLLSQAQIIEVIEAGAAGCLPRTLDLDLLVEAIRRVYKGESPVYREELQKLVETLDRREKRSGEWRSKLETLTPKQEQVLAALSSGLPIKELADKLYLSPKTVKVHIRHILQKTGAQSKAEVLDMARKSGYMQF